MRAAILVPIILLAGCASSLERVRAMRAAAPDWYEARKVEISGEAYPKIGDIPLVEASARPGTQLAASGRDTMTALQKFQLDPRAEPATETAAEMLAWAAASRRAVEGQITAPDFLTDEDVAALKAVFDVPRGRL